MATNSFRLELNSKPTRNKKYCILLCITIGGKRKRIKTPIEVVHKNDFNSKCIGDNWIRKNVPEAENWNQILRDFIEDARKQYKELDKNSIVTSEKVASAIQSKNISDSFIKYSEEKIQKMLDAGKIGCWKNYTGFLNKLKAYQKGKDLLFAEIDTDFINSFEAFLHSLSNARHTDRTLHTNTIHGVMKNFRALVNMACKEKKMQASNNPFILLSITREETTKEKLSTIEIKALEALELREGKLLWNSRNAFLLSFYCAGMRIGDLLQLRWCNVTTEDKGKRLAYTMWKNNKEADLKLVEQAEEILNHYHTESSKPEEYILPFLDNSKPYAKYITKEEKDTMPVEVKKMLLADISAKNALINKELKRLAELAGISKKVSMHIARHSFAKKAKEEGTDNSAIQVMMKHSSLTITEKYMGNFDTAKTDEALGKIFHKETNKEKMLQNIMALLQNMNEEDISSVLVALQKKHDAASMMSEGLFV